MRYKLYDKIKMITNKYLKDNVTLGTVGIIIDDYGNNYFEVQFYDESWKETINFFAVKGDDFELIDKDM